MEISFDSGMKIVGTTLITLGSSAYTIVNAVEFSRDQKESSKNSLIVLCVITTLSLFCLGKQCCSLRHRASVNPANSDAAAQVYSSNSRVNPIQSKAQVDTVIQMPSSS